VPAAFAPVVAAARAQLAGTFGTRLHSAYLYGSIPRGTAVGGVSDLDLLAVLTGQPADADRGAARAIETALDAAFAQIDGVGLVLAVRAARSASGNDTTAASSSPACAPRCSAATWLASCLAIARPGSWPGRRTAIWA
jgi:hypothetical protein